MALFCNPSRPDETSHRLDGSAHQSPRVGGSRDHFCIRSIQINPVRNQLGGLLPCEAAVCVQVLERRILVERCLPHSGSDHGDYRKLTTFRREIAVPIRRCDAAIHKEIATSDERTLHSHEEGTNGADLIRRARTTGR